MIEPKKISSRFDYALCFCMVLLFVGVPILLEIVTLYDSSTSPYSVFLFAHLVVDGAFFEFGEFVIIIFIGLAGVKIGGTKFEMTTGAILDVTHHIEDSVSVIDITTECSDFGAPLLMEEAECVGLMQFQRPNCGSIHRASQREI